MRPCKLGCFHPRRSYRYSSPSIMNPQISPKHSESGSFVLSTWYCILGSFVLDILKFTGWTMTIDCISSWYEVIWYWFLSKESRGPLWVEAGKLSRKFYFYSVSHTVAPSIILHVLIFTSPRQENSKIHFQACFLEYAHPAFLTTMKFLFKLITPKR